MISSIRLRSFRSYKDSSFEFEPGVNIIVGPNASGKTNLLEAIAALSGSPSWRAKDGDLILFARPWAILSGSFDGHDRVLKIDRSLNTKATKVFNIDTHPYRRLSLERTEPVVLFEPSYLDLLARGPETRRDFFDELLARTQPGFKQLLANYRRALAQRNALLKKGPAYAGDQLFVWNLRLSELGSQIAAERNKLVNIFNQKLIKTYSQIAGKRTKSQIIYEAQFEMPHYATRLLSSHEKNLETDLARGFTSSGPHREDFSFKLNNHPASASASRGEVRSLLLALKALELELVEKSHGKKPILLLDDVFSELDSKRRRALVQLLTGHQAILTTTDADAVIEYFGGDHQLIAL